MIFYYEADRFGLFQTEEKRLTQKLLIQQLSLLFKNTKVISCCSDIFIRYDKQVLRLIIFIEAIINDI